MTDLINDFPNWGEVGEFPADGFFYEGGDQVNEKHMDALWNGIQTQFTEFITGIEDRVHEIEGDLILDSGLAVSQGGGTREVDITASTEGAYVDGQQTGSTSSNTITLTAGGPRTDSIWVDSQGQTGKTEGTTSVGDDKHKLAEVDVDGGDTISAIRKTGHRITRAWAADEYDSGQVPGGTRNGDFWHDLDLARTKVRHGGNWQQILTEQDDVTFTAGDGLDGTTTVDLVGGATLNPSVDVTDLLGTGITEDGSNNLELNESVIKDGGAKEIDAQEFSGSDGANGNVLFTDGANAYWDAVPFPSASDDGTIVVNETTDFNFGTDVSVTDDGDGTVTINAENTVSSADSIYIVDKEPKIQIYDISTNSWTDGTGTNNNWSPQDFHHGENGFLYMPDSDDKLQEYDVSADSFNDTASTNASWTPEVATRGNII